MTETPKLPDGYALIARDAVTSTNDEAKAFAAKGAPEGTLVWARTQSAGRGRHGRPWQSPAGNLYMSLVLRPDCPPSKAAQIGFVAALAVASAIGPRLPRDTALRLKWPNDVLVDGRKISGILVESGTTRPDAVDWLVLGIGLNVSHAPATAAYPATALAEHCRPVALETMLEDLVEAIDREVRAWRSEGFGPVRARWLAQAFRKGEDVVVRYDDGERAGRFVDLDRDGGLVLETGAGQRAVLSYGAVFPPAG